MVTGWQVEISLFKNKSGTKAGGSFSAGSLIAYRCLSAGSLLFFGPCFTASKNSCDGTLKGRSVYRSLAVLLAGSSGPGGVSGMRRRAAIRTLLCGTADAAKVVRRIDQTDVGKRLGKVSQLAPVTGMVFLGKKSEVVA
jgi:hypothetical protein